jgi:hypothetical protein
MGIVGSMMTKSTAECRDFCDVSIYVTLKFQYRYIIACFD